jgi:glycerol uptake facilitator protein
LAQPLLVGLISAIGDENNVPPGQLRPLTVRLIVVAIGISFGGMHSYAIKPARDFGPRLFSVIAGFMNNGLIGSNVWITPIVAPIIGALTGVFTYDLLIGRLPARAQARQMFPREM